MKKSEIFGAKSDWWVSVIVCAALAGEVASIPLLIWQVDTLTLILPAVAFLIISILLLIDRAFFTRYTLSEDGLHITGQLRHITIPYRSMRKIGHGNVFGLFSVANQRRFALSKDCISIALEGCEWKVITLSPKQKNEFLSSLFNRVDSERTRRSHAV